MRTWDEEDTDSVGGASEDEHQAERHENEEVVDVPRSFEMPVASRQSSGKCSSYAVHLPTICECRANVTRSLPHFLNGAFSGSM